MSWAWQAWIGIVGAYLLGALPFGLILGLVFHRVDIRSRGSGNLGATNALRVLGWRAGLATLVLDALKGLGPVLLLPGLVDEPSMLYAVWVGLAAIVGHVFPVYLKFRGGKGVATSAGVLAVLHPWAFACAFAAFALVVATTRYVALGSLISVLVLSAASLFLEGLEASFGPYRPRTILFLLTCAIVFLRHAGNIKRLLRGTESRLGEPDPPPEDGETESETGDKNSKGEQEPRGVA